MWTLWGVKRGYVNKANKFSLFLRYNEQVEMESTNKSLFRLKAQYCFHQLQLLKNLLTRPCWVSHQNEFNNRRLWGFCFFLWGFFLFGKKGANEIQWLEFERIQVYLGKHEHFVSVSVTTYKNNHWEVEVKTLDTCPKTMLEPIQNLPDLVQETLGEKFQLLFCYTN